MNAPMGFKMPGIAINNDSVGRPHIAEIDHVVCCPVLDWTRSLKAEHDLNFLGIVLRVTHALYPNSVSSVLRFKNTMSNAACSESSVVSTTLSSSDSIVHLLGSKLRCLTAKSRNLVKSCLKSFIFRFTFVTRCCDK